MIIISIILYQKKRIPYNNFILTLLYSIAIFQHAFDNTSVNKGIVWLIFGLQMYMILCAAFMLRNCKVSKYLIVIFICISIIAAISIIHNAYNSALYEFSSYGIVIYLLYVNKDGIKQGGIYLASAVAIIINSIVAFSQISSSEHIMGIYSNSNSLGFIAFLLLFPLVTSLQIIKRGKPFILLTSIVIIFDLLLIIISRSRASIITLSVCLFVYYIWPVLIKCRIIFICFFIIFIVGLVSVIVIYPKIDTFANFKYMNDQIFMLTGKDILSGRQYLWVESIKLIEARPILGYGNYISSSLGLESTPHNIYLHTALTGGLIGLFIFILFIFTVWIMYSNKRFNKRIRLSASFFIAILIHESFEITYVIIGFKVLILYAFFYCFTLLWEEKKELINLESKKEKEKSVY